MIGYHDPCWGQEPPGLRDHDRRVQRQELSLDDIEAMNEATVTTNTNKYRRESVAGRGF